MRKFLLRLLMGAVKLLAEPDPRQARVREVVTWADSLNVRGQVVSGERKRNQALNRLVVEFPDSRKRDLSFLIEQVLQEA